MKFSPSVYVFNEGSGTGSVEVFNVGLVSFPFDIRVSGGESQLGICSLISVHSSVMHP